MEFTLGLVNKVSGPAADAARQMSVLEKTANAARNALTKADALGDIKKHRALTAQLKQLEAAQSALPKGLLQEAAAHKALADAHAKATKQFAASEKAKKAAIVTTKESTSSSAGWQAELAEVTGGLSVVAEVAAGVAVAFGAVVIAGMSMAIEANEAKMKMLSLFDALGEGKITGKQTVAMLDELGDSIGQTRKALAPITQGFLTMGVTGSAQLRSLTLAAASAGALAEGGAAKFSTMFGVINAAAATGSKLTIPFKKLEKQLQGVGLNTTDLAVKMGMTEKALTAGLKAGTVDAKKFGDALTAAASEKGAGPLARAGASLGNVWARFQENITKMFENIDVGPFLDQVKSLFDIFGQGKASGQALTAGIGGFFKQVFSLATKVVPYIKRFLLDLVIYGLKAYLGLRPIIQWIKDLQKNTTFVTMFWTVMRGLGTAALVVGAAIAIVIAVVVGLALVLIGIQVAIVAVGGAILGFVASAGQALAGWAASAAGLAVDFVKGLVDGISNGASAVVGAVTNLAGGAKNAFKGALGIASPSKEMAKLGKFAGEGVAVGLDASTSKVASAAGDLGGSALGATAGGASGGGKGGGGITVNVASGAIVIQGAGKGAEDLTEQAISLLFERIALAQGLG